MLLSKQTSPHVTTVMEADMTPVVRARERLKGEFARQGVKLTFTPFFIQAIVAALKADPTLCEIPAVFVTAMTDQDVLWEQLRKRGLDPDRPRHLTRAVILP